MPSANTASTTAAASPAECVNVAIVGAGGMGRGVTRNLLPFPDVRVVAVADPADAYEDDFFYKSRVGRLPLKAEIDAHYADRGVDITCAEYKDFRIMLDRHPEIDAVVCATPDHLHAYVSVVAMRMGKHVYCEKPLTHNISEARLLAEVAAQTGVATQMGNIGHARDGMRQTCEWIRDGAIGPVREVHAWVGATRWHKGMVSPPDEAQPVPADLDWDLWLGPREPRPFHPAYVPVRWRDFWEFGLGAIGDFFCHDVDVACWALDLRGDVTVEAFSAGRTHPDLTAHGDIVYYDFGPLGDRPAVRVTWYDGGLRPPTPEDWPLDEPLPSRGVFFVGEKGMLVCPGLGAPPRLLPRSLEESYEPPAPSLPRSPGHHREWIDACKGGPAALSEFAYAAQLTELGLLGVLAIRTGKKIDWDWDAMKARGLPEADALIHQTYRSGWELPE